MKRAPDPEYQAIVEKWRALCLQNHFTQTCEDCLMSMASEIYTIAQERKRADGFAYFLLR